MKKVQLIIVVVALLVPLVLGACGPKPTATEITPTPKAVTPAVTAIPKSAKEAPKLPANLIMGTNPMGSATYTVSSATAQIITKYTPMQTIVQPYDGPAAYFPLMMTGEIALGHPASHELAWAYKGQLVYDKLTNGKGFDLRVVFGSSGFATGLCVGEDSGIKKGADTKGRKWAWVSEAHYGALATLKGHLANFQISEDEIIKVPVASFAAGVQAVVEKKADVCGPSLGSAVVEELKAARGARFISLDPSPEAMARFKKFYPADANLYKAGSNTGVLEDIYLATPRHMAVTATTMPDEVAYAIVEAMWNHVEEFQAIHPLTRDLTRESVVSTAATAPYHPGTIKFFKEKGVWTAQMEKLQADLLAKK